MLKVCCIFTSFVQIITFDYSVFNVKLVIFFGSIKMWDMLNDKFRKAGIKMIYIIFNWIKIMIRNTILIWNAKGKMEHDWGVANEIVSREILFDINANVLSSKMSE